jgi:hypothetical protein
LALAAEQAVRIVLLGNMVLLLVVALVRWQLVMLRG